MKYAAGLTAGFVLILVVLVCVLAGTFLLGAAIDSRVIGGLVGGVVGVGVGFYAVYRTYLVPLRKESLSRDYSHLSPQVDDDE